MQSVHECQKALLDEMRYSFAESPLTPRIQKAFFETPRHAFVGRYRLSSSEIWREVAPKNLHKHLSIIYSNRPLVLIGDDEASVTSTISQPFIVLKMLQMLRLEPGLNVFELGTGSGWNAALMGRLVGRAGRVSSVEIIPELVRRAKKTMKTLGLRNVKVIEGDGGDGHGLHAPYDRAIFTASCHDLPRAFYNQVKLGGLLLIVFNIDGAGSHMFLMESKGRYFESIDSMSCGFVQMTGKYHGQSGEPTSLESLRVWQTLRRREVSRTPFWWGGKGQSSFMWRTVGIRSFLSITEPLFRVFKSDSFDRLRLLGCFFGLVDHEHNSLVIAKDDMLISYGNEVAKQRLVDRVRLWVNLGMPDMASLRLRVYPKGATVTPTDYQWLNKRKESQFLWGVDFPGTRS